MRLTSAFAPYQFPGEKEAVFQEFYDHYVVWCHRHIDIFQHHIIWYAILSQSSPINLRKRIPKVAEARFFSLAIVLNELKLKLIILTFLLY